MGGSRFPPIADYGFISDCEVCAHETVDFYDGVLGFALLAELGDSAAFLSAGGYPDETERDRVLGPSRTLGTRRRRTRRGIWCAIPLATPCFFALQ